MLSAKRTVHYIYRHQPLYYGHLIRSMAADLNSNDNVSSAIDTSLLQFKVDEGSGVVTAEYNDERAAFVEFSLDLQAKTLNINRTFTVCDVGAEKNGLFASCLYIWC